MLPYSQDHITNHGDADYMDTIMTAIRNGHQVQTAEATIGNNSPTARGVSGLGGGQQGTVSGPTTSTSPHLSLWQHLDETGRGKLGGRDSRQWDANAETAGHGKSSNIPEEICKKC